MVGISNNEINSYFLINIIFDGDAQRALQVARRYPRTTYTLTPKSIERYLIVEYIKIGLTNNDISEALRNEDGDVKIERIQRLRKEYNSGKYND